MPRVYKSTSKVAVAEPVVSPEDEDLWKWCWRYNQAGYVHRGPIGKPGAKSAIWIHRVVLERVLQRNLLSTELVDHINGNKADNRRSNLRLATKSQNGMNMGGNMNTSSKYAGVSWMPSRGRYQVYISRDGERFPIGSCRDEEEAAWMYDQWALVLHGEYARLNLDYA